MEERPSREDDSEIPKILLGWYVFEEVSSMEQACSESLVAIRRLQDVKEELESALHMTDRRTMYRRLEYSLENYFSRVYELRERILAVFNERTKVNNNRIKNADNRSHMLKTIHNIHKDIATSLVDLLDLMDEDIQYRNKQTHDRFISITFSWGSEIYELEDILEDTKDGPAHVRVRNVVIDFITTYISRIELILIRADKYIDLASSRAPI